MASPNLRALAGGRSVEALVAQGLPSTQVPRHVAEWREDNYPNLMRGVRDLIAAERSSIRTVVGALWLTVVRGDGTTVDYGLASLRVVTDAAVAAIVDAFQGSFTLSDFKYHAIGTGNTAEAAGDTDLDTELTTEYQTNSTRATGTTAEGSTGNIFQTVATNTLDSGNPSIVEHGIFTSATVGAGTLLDRSVFAAISLDGTAGDALQSTYELTFTAGA